MLRKQSRPTIRKLSAMVKSEISDTIISSSSPLDSMALQFSAGLRRHYCNEQGGIGLGLVVVLDNNSSNCGGEIIAKYAICSQFSIKNTSEKMNHTYDKSTKEQDIMMMEGFEEEFTYVTCHGPNKSTTTTVYYAGAEYGHPRQSISSPARFSDDQNGGSDSDFLSSCHLCRKGLQGKDIYMYRGEKAYCSAECRQRQIGIDERKEQCRSEASKASDVSSSAYSYTSRDQIFSTGIVAI